MLRLARRLFLAVSPCLALSACEAPPAADTVSAGTMHTELLSIAREMALKKEAEFLKLHAPVYFFGRLRYRSDKGANNLDPELHDRAVQIMDDLGALSVSYYRDVTCASASCQEALNIYLDVQRDDLEVGRWYIRYSSDGYTEEYQVPDVQEAIAASDDRVLHFCQPLETENWFYCFNNH